MTLHIKKADNVHFFTPEATPAVNYAREATLKRLVWAWSDLVWVGTAKRPNWLGLASGPDVIILTPGRLHPSAALIVLGSAERWADLSLWQLDFISAAGKAGVFAAVCCGREAVEAAVDFYLGR